MRTPRKNRAWWAAGLILAAGLALAGLVAASGDWNPALRATGGSTAAAGDGAAPDASAVVDGRAAVPGSGGVRAVVDPLTGELVRQPTADMLDAGAPAPDGWLRKHSADLVAMPLPRGGYIVDLEDRFQTSLVVTVAEDGSIDTDCVRAETESEASKGANHER